MAINTLSKNSIGTVLALLLVILLSESRLFNLFTETYLGRAFLIIIILFASYLNKNLGVVCVLIIVIMFSNNKFSFYEGLDGTVTTSNVNNKNNSEKKTLSSNDDTSINTHTNVPNDKINVVTSSTAAASATSNSKDPQDSANSNSKSIEGFDLQSTENNIKRGKQSNSIPVNQYYNQSIEVAPYEGSSFSNFFGFLNNSII
jgi:hypothetical protein